VVAFPPFRLDLEDERLWKGGKELSLRRKPFAILRYLVANPRRLVTHDELMKQVWGDVTVSESAVRTHLHELRSVLGEGVIETVIGRGYRFTADLVDEVAAAAAAPRVPARGDRLVVGRDAELAALRASFDRAHAGHRQLCFVTGEPGIGKTTLVDAFLDELDGTAEVTAVRGQCVEQHGTAEAYLPVIEAVVALRRTALGDRTLAALARHAATFLAQIPQLVPDDQLDDVQRRARGGSEARMVRELMEALEALAADHTLVVVIEDVQWSDLATLDLIGALGQRRERARLFVIATSRRDAAQTAGHPLNRVMRPLVARGGAASIAVERIRAGDVADLLALRFPTHALPAQLTAVIDQITAGTPLFVASVIDDLVERGMIAERDGTWVLTAGLDQVAAHRPDTVRQMIDIQLDRLTHEEQRVLEAGSVAGTELSTALVAAALGQTVEAVDDICDALARRALFLRRGPNVEWPDGALHTSYAMTHAVVQEVCSGRIAEARRQRWHRLIAERLEAAYGEQVAEVSLVLASHFEHAHVPARAIHYYDVAADRAQSRYASGDALRLFRRALDLIPRLADGPERDDLELRILTGLSPAVLRLHEVNLDPATTFERRVEIARRRGDPTKIAAAMMDMAFLHGLHGRIDPAARVLDEVDALVAAGRVGADVVTYLSSVRGVNLFWRGDVGRAVELFEIACELPPEVRTSGFGVLARGLIDRRPVMLGYNAVGRWILGQVDAAVRDVDRSWTLAVHTGDPYSIGLAGSTVAAVRFLRRDSMASIRAACDDVLSRPDAAMWHAPCSMILAWVKSVESGLSAEEAEKLDAEMRMRMQVLPLGGTGLASRVVPALARSPRIDLARTLIEDLLALAASRGEALFVPDLLTLRADLTDDDSEAAVGYLAAIERARATGARSFELRAAVALARRRKTPESLACVDAALATFTEGADTPDQREARSFLGR
jgi:DNA-binding winged helix-turn-helix (wHTH) protein